MVLGHTATGYKLLPSDSLELPPPDYNDVVDSPPGAVVPQNVSPGSQPSAPPLSELELAAAENPPPPQQVAPPGGGGHSSTDYGGTRGVCVCVCERDREREGGREREREREREGGRKREREKVRVALYSSYTMCKCVQSKIYISF